MLLRVNRCSAYTPVLRKYSPNDSYPGLRIGMCGQNTLKRLSKIRGPFLALLDGHLGAQNVN